MTIENCANRLSNEPSVSIFWAQLVKEIFIFICSAGSTAVDLFLGR